MAIIADRGISGDKMLILGSSEALYYPFDFGSGWKELRFGAFISSVGLTGSNSSAQAENLIPSNSKNTYIGWIYSPDNSLPLNSNTGNIYLGSNQKIGTIQSVGAANWNINEGLFFLGTGGVSGYRSSESASIMVRFPSAFSATGSEGAAMFFGQKLRINSNKSFQISYMVDFSNKTNMTTSSLRSLINGSSTTLALTGFYTTSSGDVNADLLPYPNKVLIYNPFLLNRYRIHNFIVEKYE